MTTSPLSQATPTSLNDVFNKDPEELSEEEITRVIEALRADRLRFVIEDAAKPATRKTAPKKTLQEIGTLTLDDLGL